MKGDICSGVEMPRQSPSHASSHANTKPDSLSPSKLPRQLLQTTVTEAKMPQRVHSS